MCVHTCTQEHMALCVCGWSPRNLPVCSPALAFHTCATARLLSGFWGSALSSHACLARTNGALLPSPLLLWARLYRNMGVRSEEVILQLWGNRIRLKPIAGMQARVRCPHGRFAIWMTGGLYRQLLCFLGFFFFLLQMRSCYVAQVGFELVILLPLVQSAMIRGIRHHYCCFHPTWSCTFIY